MPPQNAWNFGDYMRSRVHAIVREVLGESCQGAVTKRWSYERTSAGTTPLQMLGSVIRLTYRDFRVIIGERKGIA